MIYKDVQIVLFQIIYMTTQKKEDTFYTLPIRSEGSGTLDVHRNTIRN